MSDDVSALQRARAGYHPARPEILRDGFGEVAVEEGPPTTAVAAVDEIRAEFPRTFGRPALALVRGAGDPDPLPLTVGVVLSGGQAAGGHNVISGLHDALQGIHPGSRVLGFLGGPRGILENRHRELTPAEIEPYRNSGGFDMIGSGRDKIESAEQLEASRRTCAALGLDGLAIVGGDDSNTNAAVIAEDFLANDLATRVVGAPKTIDGDLKGHGVETSFGFDTATKTYSELIGNLCRDARSARKYWHFIRLMGRSASHVTLECALQTRPNLALIGEEARQRSWTLAQIVDSIADAVRRRAESGRSYGVCLVSEGLIEFVPAMRSLIDELNLLLARDGEKLEGLASFAEKEAHVASQLSSAATETFGELPERFREQLLLDRDAHGNVPVSQIETEALLIEQVERRLEEWRAAGRFDGRFSTLAHFFGYEGRCGAPTNFDADYTYGLGWVAAGLVAFGRTGYMASLRNLCAPPASWRPIGVPLTSMMQVETRKGARKPVVAKALVDLAGAPFATFAAARERWAVEDQYRYPGAIQYFGPPDVSGATTCTLELETHGAAPNGENPS
jgi:pyrophosphate--fructose-6-phosphate 1-phosphotransferase